MDNKKLRKQVLSALLAALCCVATMVVQIPSPMQGYVNLGDCFVLLSGWMLGPWYGFAAGGIGSMLADVLLGYAHYAPAAELLGVAGYFGYASLLLGKGLAAAASIPGNLVQGAAGLAAGLMLMAVMVRSQLTKKLV